MLQKNFAPDAMPVAIRGGDRKQASLAAIYPLPTYSATISSADLAAAIILSRFKVTPPVARLICTLSGLGGCNG